MLILPYRGVWPRIATSAFVAPTAVIVGDVEIGEEASVWFGVVIRADMAQVRIGPRSNVQDNTVIHTDEGAPTIIGADCTVGHAAILHGATVGDGSMVGMGARLLNHAKVGAGCIVAAGALVAEGKAIPEGQLAMGAPAKVARAVSEAERQRVREGVGHYRDFAKEYRANIASAARREPGHTGVREL